MRATCRRAAVAWLAAVSSLIAIGGRAEELPRADAAADGVFVSGVDGSFAATRAAVARAREAGRTWRVIVVDTAGAAGDARGLLDRIVTHWRFAPDGGFDPTADVTVVLATDDHRLALDVPVELETAAALDVATLEDELLPRSFLPLARDGRLDEGLAALVDATERRIADRAAAALARAEADRVFRTRTLPWGVAAMVGTGAIVALAARRFRHVRRLAAARQRLAAFKADVVALSDMLDAQQERHRMLPHADPDFRTPMEGHTRAAYDGVQAAIARYRERWLALMDVWERAQARIDAEWFLGTAAADDALKLLDSAEARPPLDEVAGACRGPLDALETAHETAREQLATLAADATAAATRVEALAARGRSGAAFQPALGEMAGRRAAAATILERDPVAARGLLESATATLVATMRRVEAVEAGDDRLRRCREQADAIASRVAARRADGWLLVEPGADPDDRLAAARGDCDLAARLLDAGDAAAATAALDRGEKSCGEAAALVESVAAARARVEELLPQATARLESLVAGRGPAAAAIDHLRRSSAEACWADVAANVARIDEGLERSRTLLAEARAAAAPDRQHYFRAVALAEEVGRQEEWVAGCQDALAERRARLDGLREALPGRHAAARSRVVELARRLDVQRTDRPRANERCREAGRLLEAAAATLADPRPDLLEAARLVEAGDAAAVQAGELAAEDDRLAQQAASELDETAALVRRAAAWYDEGVQADLRGPRQLLEAAGAHLERQRYEDAIRSAGEAASAARAAYATATAEARRRRMAREQEARRRRLEESFSRSSGGAGPWVITLPDGRYAGPDPWRAAQPPAAPPRTAGTGWSRDIAQVGW